MICPTCKAEGKKSSVYIGGSTTTLMCADHFYDEDGKQHYHDPNYRSTAYSCSNGHDWHDSKIKPCWCGWPKKADKPTM